MKVNKILNGSIKILYVLLLTVINICVIFFAQGTDYKNKKEFLVGNPLLFVAGCVLFLMVIAVGVILLRKIAINCDICVMIGTVILFILQVYLCKNIYFETAWDARVMVTAARQMGSGIYQGEFDTYFSYYPNNLFLTTILSYGCKFMTCFGDVTRTQYFLPMIVLQCAISCVTGILLYKTIKNLGKEKWAMAGWMIYVVLLGINPWLVIVYSDSMSLCISIGCLYLYTKSYTGYGKVLQWAGMALIAAIGYLIKPQNVIVFIACIIIGLFRAISVKQERKFLMGGICVALILFLGVEFLGNQVSANSQIQTKKELKMPMMHWAMMGLNPKLHGAYSKKDVLYTQSFQTTEGMKAADWEMIEERVKDYGFDGMADHLKKKVLINYGDGTFAWRCEGHFFNTLFPDMNSKVAPKLKELFYYGESIWGKLRETLVHGVWLQVLVWMTGAVGFRRKEKEQDAVNVALLTVIGTILFAMLFEARARYLMCNVSVYIVLTVLGMATMYEEAKKKISLGERSLWKKTIPF